jgi:SAM-dependent methyltransferase
MATDPAFWNELADRYSKKPVDLPGAFERKIEVTRALMRQDSSVLDVGCGTGSLALRLADAGGQIHGLDFSAEMIRVGNVTFHVGRADASMEAFELESLDGVCAYSLLHLVEDREPLIAQIFDLLKPGGFFVSSVPCLGDTWIPYRPILAVMRWLGKAPFVSILGSDQMREEMTAAGFEGFETPDVGAAAATAFVVCRKPS